MHFEKNNEIRENIVVKCPYVTVVLISEIMPFLYYSTTVVNFIEFSASVMYMYLTGWELRNPVIT